MTRDFNRRQIKLFVRYFQIDLYSQGCSTVLSQWKSPLRKHLQKTDPTLLEARRGKSCKSKPGLKCAQNPKNT